jgi:putative membrane protein
MADNSKSQLSAERTEFAEDRTLLANERTFASWVRTGYAAIGVGLGFQALFHRLQPEWVPKGIATVIFVSAILIFITAERRACAVLARLDTHAVKTAGHRQMRLLAYLSAAACAALIVIVWKGPRLL